MLWPARSPEKNPIENLRAILGRDVYKQGRQFENVDDPKKAILLDWDALDEFVIKGLVYSTPACLLALIKSSGGSTKFLMAYIFTLRFMSQ